MRRVAAVFFALWFATSALAETVVSNVVYARTSDPLNEELHLDWSVPDGASGAQPVVVFIHGGGWNTGSKLDVHANYIKATGAYIVASINYRLVLAPVTGNTTSAGIWPRQIQDVRAAIRFVRQQAGTNIAGTSATVDPDRIALYGVSAGGHLALQAALTHDDCTMDNPPHTDGPAECISCAVKAVAAWVPVIDLLVPTPGVAEATYLADPNTLQAGLLGGTVGSRLATAAAASPMTHVRADAPPVFVLSRTSDQIINREQAVDFVNALAALGAEVTLREQPGLHGTALSAGDQTAIVDFLEETL